uniref:Uncharacterized protein n=1 Tax=Opuntia streptacantha TaxID=393608 RepID=A0A7C9EMC2_OPUST
MHNFCQHLIDGVHIELKNKMLMQFSLLFHAGYEIKPYLGDWISAESDEKKDVSCQLEYLRPDALLDSFWFGHRVGRCKDQLITEDVGALLGEDPSHEYKQEGVLPSDSNQSFGPDSSSWDDM